MTSGTGRNGHPISTGKELELAHSTLVPVAEKYAGLTVEDTGDTPGVSFVTMLKAIIVKKRVLEEDSSLDEDDLERHGWSLIHGNLGFCDIMLDPAIDKLILNDFDLAAFMEPGDESLAQRTGIRPFMARILTLRDNSDDKLKRTRRHDLESITWIFAWICEGNGSQERRTWNSPSESPIIASGKKYSYFSRGFKPKAPPETIKKADALLWEPLCNLVVDWQIMELTERKKRVTLPDTEFLHLIGDWFARAPEYMTWDWTDFEIPRAVHIA